MAPVASSPLDSVHLGWVLRLFLICLGYSIVLLPLLVIRAFLYRANRLDPKLASHGPISTCTRLCFVAGTHSPSDLKTLSDPAETGSNSKSTCLVSSILRTQSILGLDVDASARSTRQTCALLGICAFGLQSSYLLWGVMQERIMTRDYNGAMFEDSQFLVFCNRFTTVFIVIPLYFLPLGILVNPLHPQHRAPFFEYSFASFSNILSSWCQYEALKYVSFPTQVLSKACKVIPVMVMGWFIQKRSYSATEYATALVICIGLNMFMLGHPNKHSLRVDDSVHLDSFSGILLIITYLALDSFTTNWQDRLFQKYSISPVQVMAGVNFWSVLLTLIPLLQRGTLFTSVNFGLQHPAFFGDVTLSALCSAVGQLFIFMTIANFGPATFVLIMTLRMGLSILLSCILFSHPLSIVEISGILLVFFALFLRLYLRSSRWSKK